jgi:hypothetical protein
MRVSQTVQPVSYELRLPDAVQAAALRLLDASREVVNATVAALWSASTTLASGRPGTPTNRSPR